MERADLCTRSSVLLVHPDNDFAPLNVNVRGRCFAYRAALPDLFPAMKDPQGENICDAGTY